MYHVQLDNLKANGGSVLLPVYSVPSETVSMNLHSAKLINKQIRYFNNPVKIHVLYC